MIVWEGVPTVGLTKLEIVRSMGSGRLVELVMVTVRVEVGAKREHCSPEKPEHAALVSPNTEGMSIVSL